MAGSGKIAQNGTSMDGITPAGSNFGNTSVVMQAPIPGQPPKAIPIQQGTVATPSPYDMSNPGIGETVGGQVSNQLMAGPSAQKTMFDATQGEFTKPWAQEGFWEGVMGNFQGGGPSVSNQAQQAYSQYMQQMPTINPEANLDPYYANARKRQTQDTNSALGARGMFNSSAALDKIAQGDATLNSQQANAEAQYGLNRASTIGNLNAIAGNLARGADMSSAAQAQSKLNYLTEGGNLAAGADSGKATRLQTGFAGAGAADSGEIARLTTAATVALGAQGAHDQRVQDAFQNITKLDGQLQTVATDAYGRIINGDAALMDAAISGDVAKVEEALNISTDQANRLMGDLKGLAEVVTAKGRK